jgi:membrane fusion protein (multidrug efflux system)
MTKLEQPRASLWATPRARWLTLIGVAVVLAGAAYGLYWYRVARFVEYTDDAYVSGNVVAITPRISGTVVAIGANNTQFVKAGDPLVRLDRADAEIDLQSAEARLASTVREVRNLFAVNAELRAEVQVERTALARAQDDYERRLRLARTGAISGEDLQHARDAVRAAQADLAAAVQRRRANQAWVDHTTLATNPKVLAAAAAVHAAFLTYARTVLPAPVSGFVAERDVQLGEHVRPGMRLMAVVPLNQVWVDANFKETQLTDMRIGQPVRLTSDLYGSGVVYHGRVIGFGAGTGSAFSLLPPQNATGNWIKIVQRVPVRIAIDPHELAAHPLQIGLSMRAYVDIRHDREPRLPELATTGPDVSTRVFSSADVQAECAIRQIIAANAPGGHNLGLDAGNGPNVKAQCALAARDQSDAREMPAGVMGVAAAPRRAHPPLVADRQL